MLIWKKEGSRVVSSVGGSGLVRGTRQDVARPISREASPSELLWKVDGKGVGSGFCRAWDVTLSLSSRHWGHTCQSIIILLYWILGPFTILLSAFLLGSCLLCITSKDSPVPWLPAGMANIEHQ